MTASITKLGIPAAVVTSALVLLAPTIAAYAVSPHFYLSQYRSNQLWVPYLYFQRSRFRESRLFKH